MPGHHGFEIDDNTSAVIVYLKHGERSIEDLKASFNVVQNPSKYMLLSSRVTSAMQFTKGNSKQYKTNENSIGGRPFQEI